MAVGIDADDVHQPHVDQFRQGIYHFLVKWVLWFVHAHAAYSLPFRIAQPPYIGMHS